MKSVESVVAIENRGLEGDRYCERKGYWTALDECQVTLIQADDVEEIENALGIKVSNGEHRRNFVVRGLDLEELVGIKFSIGQAKLQYDRPRPPCSYIQNLTEPGMTHALTGRGGICVKVVKSGIVHVSDEVIIKG